MHLIFEVAQTSLLSNDYLESQTANSFIFPTTFNWNEENGDCGLNISLFW